MKKLLHALFPLLIFTVAAKAQTLVHHWNFNNSTDVNTLLTPSAAVISGGSITHNAGVNGSAVAVTSNTTGQGFETTNPNAKNGDVAGSHLRFNNPVGASLVFALPTTGYKDVIVKYGTRRSGSGAYDQIIDYTTDGTAYQNLTTIAPVDGDPTVQTLDFSAITAVDDNPDFKVRISFGQGGGGLGGNNRFDNFSLEATANGPDVQAPTLAFSPLNNATLVDANTMLTLTFNEDVRLIDNSALNNTNVDALVELRLNDANGTAVPFDATVTGNVITIDPTSALNHNQTYYVALKANLVEDLADNAIGTVASATFTTISQQTVFAAGDLLPVAYRMNASDAEDGIALLTLVDILPGTIINLTDAKYTDNAVAQCSGGIRWTAPATGVAAGTVVDIQTSEMITNIGTLSGSDFGMSSDGDQVIVYTGDHTNPSYITAMSANAWVANNISCGGNFSKLPAGLADRISSINLSTAPANVNGLTVNAYYNGTQTGDLATLKNAILNPANWVGTTGGTPAQTWPAFAFPGPPAVVTAKVVSQTSIELVFNELLTAPVVSNFTGITGLDNIAQTDGPTATTLVLNFNTPFAIAANYSLTVDGIKDLEGNLIFSPYNFSFTYNTTIAFADNFISVDEGVGTVNVVLNIANPSAGSFNLSLKDGLFSTIATNDINYSSQTLNISGTSNTVQTIAIPVTDDSDAEMDEYFVLSLEDLNGLTLTGKQYLTVYIKDNDRKAPVGTEEISLNYVSSFKPNNTDGSTTEIVVHDAATQKLFMTSSVQNRLDIADFSNPAAITLVKSIDMTPYGGITSVAVKNGVVAVACPNADEQLNGSVVFFNTDGDFQKQVTVGALPDMITFSPDGNKVLTANEGQPNEAYTVDPEGSVSVIDISGGLSSVDQSKVNTLLFTDFNAQEIALTTSGVRKTKSTSTLSQDFEPEYISISPDSKKAWVVLQENNAIAELNLETNAYTSIWALGKKDFNNAGSGLDASDKSGAIHISNYPVKSFYMPDGIANYTANGKTFLVTANEGDEKEYGTFVERTTVGDVTLDPTLFPNAEVLQQDENLGRLRISNLSGDTDNDGDYDELIMPGSRSFSIFDTDTKTIIYDSKDDFELITSQSPLTAPIFNADNEDNDFKSRSKAKGPEPEGVALATINGKNYAFIGLERVGGVMVYDVTDPAAVKFVDYKNNRSNTSVNGDLGPEGIIFIPASAGPDGKGYLTIANEISGNVSVFEVVGATLPIELIWYQAKVQNDGKVLLNWSTASEINNAYFTVERSEDGKNFSAIAKVNTKGNGNSRQDYSFVDQNPVSGISYYRLVQTDLNGEQGKPEVRAVNLTFEANESWSVYPNPLKGNTFYIKTAKLNTSQAFVKLYSLNGKLIYSGNSAVTAGNIEVKLAERPVAGIYILNIDGLEAQQLLLQ